MSLDRLPARPRRRALAPRSRRACATLRPRWLPLLLAASLVVGPAPALPQVRLPSLGDSAAGDLDVGSERRLGDQIMRAVRPDPDYLDDPLLLDYLQSLWQPLVAAARARGDIDADTATTFAWEAFLVRDRSVNAFALPGGFIGVHLGLIAMTGSGDELAAVLAHELSHVSQRHIARSISNSSRQSLVGMAAMIVGVLAASRARSADAAQAAVMGSQAAMAQGQLNFTRDMEREADRVGSGVLTGAGFAAAGAAVMFEKLDHANRLNDNNAYPYLRSHPLTVDRIGDARARVEAAGGSMALKPTLLHAAMQGRARVLMDGTEQGLRRQQAGDAPSGATAGERFAALYASALASLQLREPARAQSALDAANALARSAHERGAERALRLLQAQVLQARGEPAQALALLDGLRAEGDTSRSLLLARAQAALELARSGRSDELRQSAGALQTWVAERRSDALAWDVLGQASRALGQPLRAVRAEAESRAAVGDLPGAIDRLRAGQRLARSGSAAPDFIESSVIDARLRELEAQRRREQLAARNGKGGPDPER